MRHALLMLLLTLAIVSCGNDATGPVAEPFSLEVEVRRPDGTPVKGLTVAVWNLSASLQTLLQDRISKSSRATTVHFSLPQPSVCWLAYYDLNGHMAQSMIEGDTLAAGLHAIGLGQNAGLVAGVEVMRYELIAQDVESGRELFRDAKYMTAALIDHTRLESGETDVNGRYFTDDRTMVPGLYDLPVMPAMDENGEQMGTFTLNDTLKIGIYDNQGNVMRLERAMANAKNTIKVTWDPQPAAQEADVNTEVSPNEALGPNLLSVEVDAPPRKLEFELDQNFPNPFN